MKRPKILKILLLAVLVMTCLFVLPTEAAAVREDCYTYTVENEQATITDCDHAVSGELRIPDTLGGYPVTAIGISAFRGCTELTGVTIPQSVTAIADYAFYGCTGLTEVSIPDTVASLGDSVFRGCTGLSSVTVGKGITGIGGSVFSGCTGLTELVIPDHITSLGSYAFRGCTGLTSLTLGKGLASVGEYAFYGCTGLTEVTIPGNVKSIGASAFRDCIGIKIVTMENGVKSLGASAFSGCTALDDLYLSNSLESLGNYVFQHCAKLIDVSIPDGVTRIPDYAFAYCYELSSVTFGEGVAAIGQEAFSFCENLTGFWVDKENTVYSNDSRGVLFNQDKTVLLQVPAKSISGSYTIPDSVKTIDQRAFMQCTDITELIIGKGVTAIGERTFYDCTGLVSVTFSDSVTEIGAYAFFNCSGLTELTIPTGITKIGSYAFYNCSKLSRVYYTGTESQWSAITVGGGNPQLTAAAVYYNHPDHDYTANPVTCGICGYARIRIAITDVVLRPSCTGLYFKGAFSFDEGVSISRYGIAVSLYSQLPVADDSDEASLYTAGQNSVLITNILGDGQWGRTIIYARPYAVLEDGTYVYGDVVATNLKTVVQAVDTQWAKLSEAQKAAIFEMYQQYPTMRGWKIPNIKEFA